MEKTKKILINRFVKSYGKSIDESKNQISLVFSKSNGRTNDIISGGVRLFYTDNEYYCRGELNGFGKGFYIRTCGKLYNNKEFKL